MQLNKPKFKIVYQSKENIWGKLNNVEKLKKQKWRKFVRQLDKIRKYTRPKKVKSSKLKLLYKHRLINIQKFKSFYGNIAYSTLKKLYSDIKTKSSFNIVDRLIISLETRLDILLFRIGLYSSIFESKQAINHRKIKVNNNYVLNGNFKLKEGDYITIPFNKKLRNLPYVQINKSYSIIIFIRDPKINDIKYPFNLNKRFIFEYLNKK